MSKGIRRYQPSQRATLYLAEVAHGVHQLQSSPKLAHYVKQVVVQDGLKWAGRHRRRGASHRESAGEGHESKQNVNQHHHTPKQPTMEEDKERLKWNRN